jgi:YfiH family protein
MHDEPRAWGDDLVDGAQFLTSKLLSAAKFRHAFFTRHGGVSVGPYASLNFSFGVGDDPGHVSENLRRAAGCLNVTPERICFVSQVHGRAVIELPDTAERQAVMHRQADAVLARSGQLACAVRSADCVPILLADSSSGAVAAVHSGWRGTVANVVAETVAKLAGDPSTLLAAIGPHISAQAFEVSAEVADQLQAAAPGRPVVLSREGCKPHVDLRAIVTAQLEAAGVPSAGIDQVEGCTVREPGRFFSYRLGGKQSGRMLSGIVPRNG